MMTRNTFNGWSNRETWATNLYTENNAQAYSLARELTADAVNKHPHSRAAASQVLAETLEDNFAPSIDHMCGLTLELLVAAIESVDWLEIAEEMVCDELACRDSRKNFSDDPEQVDSDGV